MSAAEIPPLALTDCCAACGAKFQAGTVNPMPAPDVRLARELHVCAPCFAPMVAGARAEATRLSEANQQKGDAR